MKPGKRLNMKITEKGNGNRGPVKRLLLSGATVFLMVLICTAGCAVREKLPEITEDTAYLQALERLEREDYHGAAEKFDNFLKQYPGSSYTDRAYYGLGLAWFKTEDYPMSSQMLERLLREFPQSAYYEESLYLIACCDEESSTPYYLDQEWTKKAIERFRYYLLYYPSGVHSDEAAEKLARLVDRLARKEVETGKFYLRRDKFKAANLYFETVLELYHESDLRFEAMLGLAQCAAAMGDWEDANLYIREITLLSPDDSLKEKARGILTEHEKNDQQDRSAGGDI